MKHTATQSFLLGATIAFIWSAIVSAVVPVAAQHPSEEPQDELETWRHVPEHPETITVAFESFRVYQKAGQLHIDFELRKSSREILEEFDIHLWIDAYVKDRNLVRRGGYTATKALSGDGGSVVFPDWLDIPESRQVRLCLMGTTATDNLALGRGYFCTEWATWNVKTRRRSSEAIVAYAIEHKPGILPYPSSPWHVPRTPEF